MVGSDDGADDGTTVGSVDGADDVICAASTKTCMLTKIASVVKNNALRNIFRILVK